MVTQRGRWTAQERVGGSSASNPAGAGRSRLALPPLLWVWAELPQTGKLRAVESSQPGREVGTGWEEGK